MPMFLRKMWALLRGGAVVPELVIHDPEATRPHDLDNPLFDRKVQERFGAEIAKAARKRPTSTSSG